jgi:hypothetical protein
MRPCAFFRLVLATVLLGGLGCPLDIEVRAPAEDAGCPEPCQVSCDSDAQCPDGQRCDTVYNGRCEAGPRLTQECTRLASCPAFALCEKGHCALRCTYGCPPGYQCGPEGVCVETCTGGPPETLGNFCESSMACARCGFCVSTGGAKRCHQPCKADAECAGGAPGACQPVGEGSPMRVCRLP